MISSCVLVILVLNTNTSLLFQALGQEIGFQLANFCKIICTIECAVALQTRGSTSDYSILAASCGGKSDQPGSIAETRVTHPSQSWRIM